MYIPENINYDEIKGISNIARAGLDEVRPYLLEKLQELVELLQMI